MAHHNHSLRQYGNVLGGSRISDACRSAFEQWHGCVKAMMSAIADPEKLEERAEARFMKFVGKHVDDSVELCPPVYYSTYTGKGPFSVILTSVAKVFGTTFTYHRQWLSDNGQEWALEFTADGLGGTDKSIRGIDLVTLNEEGKITNFRILAGWSSTRLSSWPVVCNFPSL